MRSIASALVLLIVLAVVGLLAMRQTQVATAPGIAASGPEDRAKAAQAQAADNVARAMNAASAARDAAEPK